MPLTNPNRLQVYFDGRLDAGKGAWAMFYFGTDPAINHGHASAQKDPFPCPPNRNGGGAEMRASSKGSPSPARPNASVSELGTLTEVTVDDAPADTLAPTSASAPSLDASLSESTSQKKAIERQDSLVSDHI